MKITKCTKFFLFASLPLFLVQLCGQTSTAETNVPESLKPPSDQVLLVKAKAKGVQIYKCVLSSSNSKQFEWTLKAPQARLIDEKGQTIIRHYVGPTWKATDGSSVVGEVKAKADSPNKGSIPWLLLTAKAHDGTGLFSKVKSIQRLETEGGKAPTTGCSAKTLNTETQVNYQATYYFYQPAQQR